MNTIFSLMGKDATRASEILGFWPKEGEVHYITDVTKKVDIRNIILNL